MQFARFAAFVVAATAATLTTTAPAWGRAMPADNCPPECGGQGCYTVSGSYYQPGVLSYGSRGDLVFNRAWEGVAAWLNIPGMNQPGVTATHSGILSTNSLVTHLTFNETGVADSRTSNTDRTFDGRILKVGGFADGNSLRMQFLDPAAPGTQWEFNTGRDSAGVPYLTILAAKPGAYRNDAVAAVDYSYYGTGLAVTAPKLGYNMYAFMSYATALTQGGLHCSGLLKFLMDTITRTVSSPIQLETVPAAYVPNAIRNLKAALYNRIWNKSGGFGQTIMSIFGDGPVESLSNQITNCFAINQPWACDLTGTQWAGVNQSAVTISPQGIINQAQAPGANLAWGGPRVQATISPGRWISYSYQNCGADPNGGGGGYPVMY